jgi:hypothetical protein
MHNRDLELRPGLAHLHPTRIAEHVKVQQHDIRAQRACVVNGLSRGEGIGHHRRAQPLLPPLHTALVTPFRPCPRFCVLSLISRWHRQHPPWTCRPMAPLRYV